MTRRAVFLFNFLLWALIFLGIQLAFGRDTTFAWDRDAGWPAGTTVELCSNGVCATGLTGTQHTLSVPIQPGEDFDAKVRAVTPAGWQCGTPPTPCPYSDWTTAKWLWPAEQADGHHVLSLDEDTVVADPAFAELGTLTNTGVTLVSSMSSTIANVSVGDLLIVLVQRVRQPSCTGVASSSPALTFTKIVTAESGDGSFNVELWAAIATSSASSQVITASYSNSDNYGTMVSARYTPGVTSITPTALAGHATLQSLTTNRTITNISPGVRTLIIAAGTNWDFTYSAAPETGWTERVDGDTFGAGTTGQFMFDRVANAGTYPSGNFATNATADKYIAFIVAFPVDAGGAAPTALPRRAFDGPFYGPFGGSVQ